MNLNSIRIEVLSAHMRELKGTSRKTGNDYHMAMQEAYVHTGNAYPDKIELPCIRNSDRTGYVPYPPGNYGLTIANFTVRDGRLLLDLQASPLVALDNPLGDVSKPSESSKAVEPVKTAPKPAQAA